MLVYVPLHLPINRITDLEVQGIECICLELHFPRSKPISRILLDHIFTNDMASVLKSGNLSLSLSDHLLVFVSWKSRSIKSKVLGHKTITFRSTKNISIANFLSD